MEYKIGQVFEINGKWYQFVEVNGTCCNNCVFNAGLKCSHPDMIMHCAKFFRLDGKNGHVVLLDAIGREYKQGGAIFRDYRCQTKPVTTDRRVYISNSDSDVSLIISIKIHDLVEKFEQNKKDMEENNNAKHSNSENIGKNLKPFDLQAAKSGKPVCTRSGKPVRIICFDAKGDKPIIALIEHEIDERPCNYFANGRFYSNPNENNHADLMMLPEKKEGWAVIRRSDIYENEEQAKEALLNSHTVMMVRKITWEE